MLHCFLSKKIAALVQHMSSLVQANKIFLFSLKCITAFKHKYPYIEFNSENTKNN